jgi:predicted  nucleic acid-binding Zn-ribbon protein
MKSCIHEILRGLLELHRWEARLTALEPGERANAEAQIQSLRANIPKGVLIVHDQARTRGRRSVAEVRNGVCSGCHLALGVGNVAALRAGEMRRCGNCGRYVYLAEPTEGAVTAGRSRKERATRSRRLPP